MSRRKRTPKEMKNSENWPPSGTFQFADCTGGRARTAAATAVTAKKANRPRRRWGRAAEAEALYGSRTTKAELVGSPNSLSHHSHTEAVVPAGLSHTGHNRLNTGTCLPRGRLLRRLAAIHEGPLETRGAGGVCRPSWLGRRHLRLGPRLFQPPIEQTPLQSRAASRRRCLAWPSTRTRAARFDLLCDAFEGRETCWTLGLSSGERDNMLRISPFNSQSMLSTPVCRASPLRTPTAHV